MSRGRLLAIVLAALVVAALWLLPVRDWIAGFLSWTQANASTAWAIYVIVYIAATVCFIPALPLTIAAGAIFGVAKGFVLVSLSSTLGATAAFVVGRTLARAWVAQKIAAWPRFKALDRSLQARGFWIVMLTRLSPLFPFFLLNYAYGVSAVKARDFVPASWLGMMPATLAYVYAGSVAASLAQALSGQVDIGRSGWFLLALGLAATIAVTILVTRLAGRELEREIST